MKSLNIKINLITIICIVLVNAIFGMTCIFLHKADLEKNLAANANLILKSLTNNLSFSIVHDEDAILNKTIYYEMNNREVLGIILENEYNEQICGYYKDEWGKIFKIAESSEIASGRIYMSMNDIIFYDGRSVGSVTIYLTDNYIESELRRVAMRQTINTLLLLLIIIPLINFIMLHSVIHPLIAINRIVGEYCDKKLTKRIKVLHDDEIGSLSHNINILADVLSADEKK